MGAKHTERISPAGLGEPESIRRADNKVERRFINVDRAIGDQWLVLEGLAAGDQVVLEGLQKIREGAEVTTVPATVSGSAEAH